MAEQHIETPSQPKAAAIDQIDAMDMDLVELEKLTKALALATAVAEAASTLDVVHRADEETDEPLDIGDVFDARDALSEALKPWREARAALEPKP